MNTKKIRILDQFGNPVEGVNITDGTVGTITNQNGCATIEAMFFGNNPVTFSHVSFVDQTHFFNAIPDVIYLESDAIVGDEIIITATGGNTPVAIPPVPVKVENNGVHWLTYLVAGVSVLGFFMSLKNNKEKPTKVAL